LAGYSATEWFVDFKVCPGLLIVFAKIWGVKSALAYARAQVCFSHERRQKGVSAAQGINKYELF
jgi:hypothetical protein